MSSAELRSDHNFRNAKRRADVVSSCKHPQLHESDKDNSHEFISRLESELKVLNSESVDILKLCGQDHFIEEFYSRPYSVAGDAANLDQQLKDCSPCTYSYKDRPLLMLQNVVRDGSPLKMDSTRGFKDFDYYSHLDSEWMGVEKAEPWWRTADKELGSPKPSGCSGNFDLSWPQCLGDESYSCSSQVSMADKGFLVTRSQHKRLCVSKTCSTHGSIQPVSDDENLSSGKVVAAEAEASSSDLSKAQLLEALCHSQTRAREAEQLAQQAFNEKEHVIKLFFKQASHLFAYRQWLQILQLEALCRKKDEENCNNLSPLLHSFPNKGRKLKRYRQKPIKKKTGKGKSKINKCAVAFALGLSLAGAGLLLGWTMGWLFPAF